MRGLDALTTWTALWWILVAAQPLWRRRGLREMIHFEVEYLPLTDALKTPPEISAGANPGDVALRAACGQSKRNVKLHGQSMLR